jgi:hypothetical protein
MRTPRLILFNPATIFRSLSGELARLLSHQPVGDFSSLRATAYIAAATSPASTTFYRNFPAASRNAFSFQAGGQFKSFCKESDIGPSFLRTAPSRSTFGQIVRW